MQKIHGKRLIVNYRQDQVDKLDKIAEKFGITRSEAVRLIMDTGLDTYETFALVGVVKLAELSKRARKAIRASIQPSLI